MPYAVGLLTAERGSDLLSKDSWTKSPVPVSYTMEVNNGVMIQCRAKYNGDMTEEVKEFVELFKRKKLKRTERKAG